MDTPAILVINGITYVATDGMAFQKECESRPSVSPHGQYTLMSPNEADKAMGWRRGECAEHIRSGRMRYVQTPGSKRKKVNLVLLKEFLEENTHRELGPFSTTS